MGHDKRYDGYEAFDYLEAGVDYEAVDLADTYAGFEPHPIELDDEEAERVASLAAENPVISLHDHAFYFPEDVHADIRDFVREGRIPTAYADLAATPLDAVFDMHLDGLSGIHSKHGWKWDDIVHDVAMRACDITHSSYAFRCGSVEDIHAAHEAGTLAIVPAIESSAMIENELDRIELLYGLGVRCMGITYNASNSLGTGQGDIYERDGGLTGFGTEAIDRMNAVGMAISTSHASPQTTLDVCGVTDAPIFDTHALAQTPEMGRRGSSDEELEAIADTGGVIGILSSTHLRDIEEYMDHFEYMVDLVGIDHVAFGPDVLYGDHTELLEVLTAETGVGLPENTLRTRYVHGLENPTEAWQNIPRWLVANGYDDEAIAKVLGGNVIRVLEDVW